MNKLNLFFKKITSINNNKVILDNFLNGSVYNGLNYEFDHVNLDKLNKNYKCNNHITNLFTSIIKKSKLFKHSDFVKAYNKNVKDIIRISKISKTYIYIICPNNDIKKSNFFYTLLTYYLIKNKATIEGIFYNLQEFNNHIKTLPVEETDKILAIISDDVSYSGSQLASFFSGKYVIDKRVYIYFNIVGYQEKAQKLIEERSRGLIDRSKLIFGAGSTFIQNQLFNRTENIIQNILNLDDVDKVYQHLELYKLYKFNLSKDVLKSKVESHEIIKAEEIYNSAIILFQKYPDSLSTYQYLCFFNFIETDYTLNMFNLFKSLELSPDILLNEYEQPILKKSFTLGDLLKIILNKLDKIILKSTNPELTSKMKLKKINIESILHNTYLNKSNNDIIDILNNSLGVKFIEKCNNLSTDTSLKKIKFKDGVGITSIKGPYNEKLSSTININTGRIKFDICTKFSIRPFYKEVPIFISSASTARPIFGTVKKIVETYFKKKYLIYKKKYLSLK